MPKTEPMTAEDLAKVVREFHYGKNKFILSGPKAVELIAQRDRELLTKAAERAKPAMRDMGMEECEISEVILAILAPHDEKEM